jgi:hypothetical protein
MASKYLKKFPVPKNFETILYDFAKEVLRNQPKDIIDFGIEYFKALELNPKFNFEKKEEVFRLQDSNKEYKDTRLMVENKLEFSYEDKNRLQNSMDKIDQINGKELSRKHERKEEKIVSRLEREERAQRYNINFEEKHEVTGKQKYSDKKVGEKVEARDNNSNRYEMIRNDFINREINKSLKENNKDWYEKCFTRLADIGQNQNSKNNNLQKEEKSLKDDNSNWYIKCKVRLTDIDSNKSDLNSKNNNNFSSKENGTWYNKCLTRLFGW